MPGGAAGHAGPAACCPSFSSLVACSAIPIPMIPTPCCPRSLRRAASHEAHLNRMVSLGVVPPMLARMTSAVDQVGREPLPAGACVQPGSRRAGLIVAWAGMHSETLVAGWRRRGSMEPARRIHVPPLCVCVLPRLLVRCRCFRTSRLDARCSSR